MKNVNNSVTLIGRVGVKPEIRTYDSGAKRMELNVATNERQKSKTGEWNDITTWHRIVVWGKQCEYLAKVCDKGTQLAVLGKLVHRNYEKNGVKQYITEVEMSDFMVMNSKINVQEVKRYAK